MLPFLKDAFGNAASKHHAYGWFAAEAVEVAREELASLLGVTGRELVFTSGATESINLAIQGTARRFPGCHIITQATEHKAVLDVVTELERRGHTVSIVSVDPDGRVYPDELEAAFRDETRIVSIMHGNNEIGTLQDLEMIGDFCRSRDSWFHVDASQTVGKLPLDLRKLPVDLLSLSGHKFYGPKGVGALFLRRRDPRVTIEAISFGGGHERGLRSGTLNVPAIVGLGAAAALAAEHLGEDAKRGIKLRDKLERKLRDQIPEIQIQGPTDRLYCNLNAIFPEVDAEALLLGAREVAASTGSACSSASLEPSHVLRAIGLPLEAARSAVRFSVGRFTTEDDVERAATSLIRSYRELVSTSSAITPT